jgi:hypothetical protein
MTHPAHGQALKGNVAQSAKIGGLLNCTRLMFEVIRYSDPNAGNAQHTWLSYDVFDCPPGSSDPTQLRTRVSQQIPDADFEIQPHQSRIHTTASDGTPVNIQWTITDALHATYEGKWTSKANGVTTSEAETRDTRSATLTGTLLGMDLVPRSGLVVTTTRQDK